ncbi:AbrB/MazE/SpoVT family DNA-binding domain-containing protein [Polynucleobacter sp. AP-Nino-20-G2]|uniref:AbrB/MazE/SpoVT family DNA-binding domain-containing protein n=1 Tax=Polynucleobacter sp. AP-Nino-20-G2 TaxID=2576917 RepID=UPI001BFD1AED|nr:AbrB/MazE/SpoVT family DNA-binding domain-containing protein [Polynucleobacter sp. AP-Nino-20-G2]QWE17265.1 AbrB/MazE/SpoVT family DNA-binding domain-containing protein [Polynucleobacter sp. AP-Nino-20-G2]
MKKQLHLQIRQIGNSRGVVIPKAILEQVGLDDSADLVIEGNKLVLSKPKKNPREGWAEDSRAIAEAGEDQLVMGDFMNEADGDWAW